MMQIIMFRCGQCNDNWLLGDDVASPTWHELDCDFINGRDTRNIPISKYKYFKTITYLIAQCLYIVELIGGQVNAKR